MSDELELLRDANPAPVDGDRFGDGPLDHHAERHLNRLLHAPSPGRPGRRSRRRAGLLWGLTATATVVTLSLTVLLSGPGTTPATAAPRPLTVHARSIPVPLSDLAELARVAATGGEPKLRKGMHAQSWSLGMRDDGPPVLLPQETVVRWNADDSRTEIVVATDPNHHGRPVLTDEGDKPHLVEDGHVISRKTYPPSWNDAPPWGAPPHEAKRLLGYLKETAQPNTATRHLDHLTTPDLLDAVDDTLNHWTLGVRESAALVRLLADRDDLRPVGQVTDRLGRTGQAYVYDEKDRRAMLILDPRTGAVLGLEYTFIKDAARYGVRAGDVMQYSAWMS